MIRLGIAGIGTIARDYIGLIAAGCVKDVELTALCSRSDVSLHRLQTQYSLSAKVFQDYRTMLDSDVVDAVLITTPHGLHPEMAIQAVNAGIHVLVEKPVGIYCDEVEQVLAALEKRPELVCGVMYNRRASRCFRTVKQMVEQGQIGELVRCTWVITDLYRTDAYYSSDSWRGSWQSEGGGILMTQASHQLDLMQWICGMPVSVQARCTTQNRPIKVENEAELFLTYPNGAHGHFIASAHECPGRNMLEICGTRGRITVENDRALELLLLERDEREFTRMCPLPFEKAPYTVQTWTFDDSDNKVQQAATIQNFVWTAEGRETMQCTLAEGLKSLQIIHGAYLSSWKGGEIALPVDETAFCAALNILLCSECDSTSL